MRHHQPWLCLATERQGQLHLDQLLQVHILLLKKVLSSGHNTDIEEAFEFAFGHRAVCAAIVGTITPAHLRANIGAVNKAVEKAVGRSG